MKARGTEGLTYIPLKYRNRLSQKNRGQSKVKQMEGKASPKREFKHLRSRNQKTLRSNLLLEAITKANNNGGVISHINEDGVLRMKIVIRKQDLKQMLGIINGGGRNISANNYHSSSPSSISVEERLNLLRRKHLLRSNALKRSCHSWSPELQSIPEE